MQIRHFESLDNKAGIVLGFAGVLASQIAMEEQASEVLRGKALRLRVSISLLGASILFFAILILMEGVVT